MFAVIKTGGKQYKVAKDDIIIVEKLDAEAGKTVEFGEILMAGEAGDIKLGDKLKGAAVKGEVLEQRKAAKVLIFKKKRRQTYRRKRGHRQNETVVKITSVKA
jgi:large subunit ribosomal protein L21